MAGMFQLLDLLVLSCFFLSVEAQPGQIPALKNVSLQWVKDFHPQLSWAPPPDPLNDSCVYEANFQGNNPDISHFKETAWYSKGAMEGGSFNMSVSLLCGDRYGEKTEFSITYPELVKDVQCYIRTSGQAHCSWLPLTTDVKLFYWLENKDGLTNPRITDMVECSSYNETDNRTGCDVQAVLTHTIYLLFNRTLNTTVVRNTYIRHFKDDVRPPPLNWTVARSGDKLIIKWDPPELIPLSLWKFDINYTECDETKTLTTNGETFEEFFQKANCPYIVKIRATTDEGEIPWSEERHIGVDAETDSNGLVYAAFIIPLMTAILVALAFMFYRKNKEAIFPKVPEPRDFLSDISDNNNKVAIGNLYIPAKEEDDCKITLVIDPLVNKLYP